MSARQFIADRPWILALGVAVAVAAWLLSGMLGREQPGSPLDRAADVGGGAAAAMPRVQVQRLVAQPIQRIISVKGNTAPARQVQIKSETDGRVVAIEAERGERLRAGQVILRLDLRDRRARLEQARAAVVEHETAYQGQLKLKAEGYVSDTQIAGTLAQLEAARAELKRAELDLEYMQIRAPFDGVIQDRQVEVGDFVKRGDPVASFVDETRLIVTGSVAEQNAAQVRPGTTAEARLVTGQTVTGTIRYVAPVADEATRTFTVELEVPNPDGALPAGVTAELLIPGGELLAQKVAPSLLSLNAAGDIGIKTIDQYHRVEFYPVEIARSEVDGVWVSGLPETADVIVLGQGYVDVGAEVEPVFADQETALAEKAP
ncbi:MAG: efflux RND transporter periplasmic adaptor subunit [Gammaproteobacteria bacterium]|nr:MAG: efflux RND transporter periplasmic adaptor subunit [Gammaproteobacteria bacterium]